MNDDVWKTRYIELERERDDQAERTQAIEALLKRLIGRLCLAARGLGADLDRALERTQQAMRGALGTSQLEELLSELSDAVARTEAPVVKQAQSAVAESFDAELRSALSALLGGLELDVSLRERASELRGQLESARELPQAVKFCAQLSDLIAAQRERAKLEQADLQRVLLQVDTRLHEFVSYLRGEEAEREAASASRQQLDEQMLGEVRGLNETVRSADDLGTLRSQLAERLEAMDAYLKQFRLRETERAEGFRERAERMRSRVEQLESETRQLQASLAREQINATTDPLTGVPNRLAYEQRVALEFKRWKRFGRPLCLVAWDIDHFKAVNDGHGHQAGDAVIRSVAKLLARQIRETDFVARYGGEEFVMLLVDTAPEAAMAVLEKVRRSVEQMVVKAEGRAIKVTTSAGLAEFRGEEGPDAVFARADRALYRAKQNGRNRCERA
ncbi:GGDEF domain-containing protein [Pseudomarimonas salicorniae]|uniref:diguanylate cyclase n=1 Tax=Pseudomarimonas salicorniae TaxID=2933270 RepID=A0ABT0GGN6_9GAMM|nr:GGDEF domain-containing protein [Lysobacter sp. CAU 1642]MCK7593690.1 diguanylate cyclase [Lysobacter sp. CAU 1642]